MSFHAWASVIILGYSAVLFLTRWIRLEIVALAIPVALYLTGALPEAGDALSGFGNQAVIAIAAVFVLGAGIEESGLAAWLARMVQRVGGSGERSLLLLITVVVAVLSAFMSNAATVAVLLPVVIALARRSNIPASRLLMPLGFAAILGGNLTLIGTSSNLLVAEYYRQASGESLGMFDFAVIGSVICVAGILYLVTIGRRLLPVRLDQRRPGEQPTVNAHQLLRRYGIAQQIVRMRVGRKSSLAGKKLSESGIGKTYQVAVLQIVRKVPFGERWFAPGPNEILQVGDELYLDGPEIETWRLAEDTFSRMGLAGEPAVDRILDHGFTMAEISIPQRSPLLGKTLRELDFRGKFGVNVMSIWRDGAALEGELAGIRLQAGDALLLAGSVVRVRRLQNQGDFVLLTAPLDMRDFQKAPAALLGLALALVPPMAFGVPLAMSALLGAIMMVITGAVPAERAGKFIDWRVLAMIIGTIPLGFALEKHGVSQIVATSMVELQPYLGAAGVLSVLYLLAAIISITSSNAAAAVILSPVALLVAEAMNFSPRNSLLAVAFGCSCAFVVPFAHQCNLMVAGPGRYRIRDFWLVGSGLSLVVAVVTIGMLSLSV
ncbi:MAG: SLC13 family permease [Planctomycetota bacterium]|nr:SLC13 family permease [Planctomycetota bacterium]MDA1114709.1 SLC13 family permease [Planctomycetota bacterium]